MAFRIVQAQNLRSTPFEMVAQPSYNPLDPTIDQPSSRAQQRNCTHLLSPVIDMTPVIR